MDSGDSPSARDEIDLAEVRDWDEILDREQLPLKSDIVITPGMKLNLIDDEFARELAQYGKKHRGRNFQMQVAAFAFGAIVLGAIPVMLNFNIWPWFIASMMFATMYASLLALRVNSAFHKRQYRTVARLMNRAMFWNSFCSPLTIVGLLVLSRIQTRMMLLQGRYMELEALLLITRASSECKVDWSGIPKNAMISNDLACTYIVQQRPEEALLLLKDLLYNRRQRQIKPYAIVNMALCYVKLEQFDEAVKLLKENQGAIKKAPKLLKIRIQLINAVIELKRGSAEDAQRKLDELIPDARKLNESDEFLAFCYMYLAEARYRQKSFDDAELYYRTAIDLYKLNENPSYWCLAETMREYAAMLHDLGRTADEEKVLKEAGQYEAAYFERELMRLTYLKYVVTHEKPVFNLVDLVNEQGFPPLSIEINPPGLEDKSD